MTMQAMTRVIWPTPAGVRLFGTRHPDEPWLARAVIGKMIW